MRLRDVYLKVKLGDYLTVLTDYHANGAYKKLKENVTLKDDPDYAVMIRTTNFENNDFAVNLKYIDEHAYNFLTKSKVYPRDILMNKIASPGSVFQMPDLGRPVSLAMNLFLMRTDETRLDQTYAYYWLKVNEPYVKSFSCGAATATITKNAVRELVMHIPPLPVQRKIAGILSAYDELIENSQRRIKILESMARSLYREWFFNFRFPGHEKVKLVPSPLGDIPKGWEVKPLEALMCDHIGGGWGKDAPDDDHTEPAFVIRGTDIPDARSSQVAGVPHRYHAKSNIRSRKLEAGDIVFEVSGGSKGQPVGRTLLITTELLSAFDCDVICASFCKRIRPDANRYNSELLYLSFLEGYDSGEIEQFQVQSTGISNFKWTEYIEKTERIIPPTQLRLYFCEQVGLLLKQIATLGLQIQNLRRTRDLLLPRLLSGQMNIQEEVT